MFFMRFRRQHQITNSSLAVKTAFGELKNPIGLAAGFDKTGKHLSTLQSLGFGYLVAGTITLDPWLGHPKPRIVRNIADKTLLNCLGFPNPGADVFVENIREQKIKVPVIASISGRTADSILDCYDRIQPHVSAVELNLSSPNTQRLEVLREVDSFRSLATRLSLRKRRPTYLKVHPFHDAGQSSKNIEMLKIWSDVGFEGTTASNSVLATDSRLSMGAGGLSGPPLFPYTINAIREIRRSLPNSFEINSAGGISKPKEAAQALTEGATTIQLFTSLVYEGPGLIRLMMTYTSGTNGKSMRYPNIGT